MIEPEKAEIAVMLAIAGGLVVGVSLVAVSGAQESRQEARRESLLESAFKLADVKGVPENMIKHVIKTEKGNCTLLSSDLTPVCTQVKATALKLGYELK